MTEAWLCEHVWPRFSRVLGREEIYLANHSLGRVPDRTADDVRAALDLWYAQMDDAWEPWIAEANLWRGNVAKLIGLSQPDAVVPKTSAGQGLRAVLNAFPQDRPVQVVTTRGEFDSVDFILKTYAHTGRAEVTWVEPSGSDGPVPLYTVDPIADALTGRAGLVVVSLVFFSTGQVLQDLRKLVAAAHERGWLVLVDLYHAVGVIPIDVEALGADFGIGGSYKYLRGGPGACWLAIHPRRLRPPSSTPEPPSSVSRDGSGGTPEGSRHEKTEEGGFQTLDTGWFAKKNTFGYQRSDEPQFADGGDGWLESTPPVLMPYQAKAGLELVLELGVPELREYGLSQQAQMRRVFRSRGVEIFEPSDPTGFGAFSLLRQENAAEFCKALKQKGVNTDSRGEFVRFGPDILNSEDEFERAALAVKSLF